MVYSFVPRNIRLLFPYQNVKRLVITSSSSSVSCRKGDCNSPPSPLFTCEVSHLFCCDLAFIVSQQLLGSVAWEDPCLQALSHVTHGIWGHSHFPLLALGRMFQITLRKVFIKIVGFHDQVITGLWKLSRYRTQGISRLHRKGRGEGGGE